MPRADELTVKVSGKEYGGWKTFRMTRGLERAVADLAIDGTEHWPLLKEPWRIPEGATIEAWLGDDKVLTGYVDSNEASFNATAHGVKIGARSKTCDLVDCSSDVAGGSFANLSLKDIAERLARPFGIDIVCDVDTGRPFPNVSVQNGEEPWKLIERLARQRRLLITDDEEGRLVITRLGRERAKDVVKHPDGGWVKITGGRDLKERFSHYIVKAQAGGEWAGVAAAGAAAALSHAEGRFTDPGVPRYRPKLIVSESAGNSGGALERAEWDMRRRIGKSLKISCERIGWRQSDGTLWRPNLLTRATVPFLDCDTDMAVGEVTWSKAADGTRCAISLHPPDAFTPEPAKDEGEGAGAGGGTSRWGGAVAWKE